MMFLLFFVLFLFLMARHVSEVAFVIRDQNMEILSDSLYKPR